ncbi:MAG: hypothetical protein ABS85_05370 [Sphingobacteriales bacterium SCN 48-20]|uniref:TonB-dependent receptor plug domain-containing protein n=1 Tax=Terrimonas ferruginea TaxID=249 RepID=UPI00086C9D15|nr:TonB-dependent receptor [Terrimonas ferruginea]MBN8784571.1 TonB-dependent receptor [Terrimonas ferruginea]ODT93668.1 MAG: hypothetical protein ABS85_05370 [Sphingobacteriales bacterium SCN 48-20]OJW39518.1 MAG: hypothetical protein BGO56_01495 [Sphingobacteriales bacterium 48-107]
MKKIYALSILLAGMLPAFAQTDTTQALGEVVVTGQYAPQPLRSSVYKVRTINAEYIRMRGATDIVGVLNSELGIRFATDNTLGESDTRILGLGGARVKILIDGVPLADRDATKQSLTQIDINTIEKIEIVEGPMSVIYGTDALAGVINIITRKGVKGRDNLSVSIRVQEESIADTYSPFSGNGIHNENITINWNNAHWKASAYITRNNFGGYTDTAAFPAKVFKPKDQWMGGVGLGYRFRQFNAWYRVDYLNEELFAASPMNLNTGLSFRQYYITNRYTHQLQTDWTISPKWKLNTAASLQDYKRNTESYTKNYVTGQQVRNDNPANIAAGYWDITKFQTFFFRAAGVWEASPKVSVQPGFDIKYDKTSGQRVSGTPSITDYSFFLSSEIKPVSWVNIRPGVRFSKNSVYEAPPVIPSINTKFRLSKTLDLRASYARGFRAPILRELYFNFFDANHSIQGNPDLKAETSNSYMLSISCNTFSVGGVRITSSLSGFYNDYRDFIDLYGFRDANNNEIFSYFNRDRYRTIGGIFDNTITWRNLTANVGVSYIGYYNKFQEDKSLAGERSRFAWSPEVNANVLYAFPQLKGSVGLYYKFTGKIPVYNLNADDEIVLSERDAFHWADLTLSKDLFKYFRLQAGVRNLFDVTRLNSTQGGSSGAHSGGAVTNYAYGRSYFAGIVFQWNKSTK